MRKRTTTLNCALLKAVLAWALLMQSSPISQAADILVYSTTVPPGQYEYPAGWFDSDLPEVLAESGHTATVTDRILTPVITSGLLTGYDQLWILSTDEDSIGHFSQSEIDAVLQFRAQGHGLHLAAEHTYAPQGQFYPSDANQIANELGVDFFGLVDHGVGGTNGPISPNFGNHPIGRGVVEIHGHDTEALMSVSPPVEVVATYQGDILIAALDDGLGRVTFDVSYCRLWDTEIYWANENPRLIHNYAAWLQGDLETVPSLGPANLTIICGLLGLVGILFLRRRQQIV